MPEQEFKVGALGLLESYLEFNSLRPTRRNWNEARLAGDPYGLICYRRLVALFKAFGIPCKPAGFHTGEWLDPGSPDYAPLVGRIYEELPEGLARGPHPDALRRGLGRMFRYMLQYRMELHSVLRATSGVLEASGLFLHTVEKIDKMNGIIHSQVGIIDGLLAELISPRHETFSVAELVRDYGYLPIDPDEALFWI
jgi:hypothetical protein